MAGKTFIIGIDGGDLNLIKDWVREGKLPSFARLMEEGSFGPLRSTIPPITGAAWSSFQTGTNPGKHGAFNWFKRVEDEYRATPVTSRDIAEPTLWQILGKFEKKVGVLGVPVTYPVSEVNGYIVPGLLTPYQAEKQSFPRDLIDEIRERQPGFKFSPKEWTRGYKPDDWVEELKQDVGTRLRVTKYLMDYKPWDFMMVHFMESDQVQHFMWNYHQDKGSDWDPVLEVYQEIDRAVGELMERLDEEDTLLIMSDHGFEPLNYNFHIDTWLLREGYIKFKKNFPTWLKRLGFNLGFTKETAYPVGAYIYPIMRKAGMLNTAIELASHPWLEWLFLSSQNVDWSNTKAYTHSEIGHIYLNIKGREPDGALDPEDAPAVRQEIVEKLKNLKNPFNGKKIIGEIYDGRKLYHGEKVEKAPDIVFLPADMEILGKGAYEFLSHRVVSKARAQSGHHRMEGLFFARGAHIKQGREVKDMHIMDIAPTVLYSFDLPILDSMDGKVIKDIYSDQYKKDHEIMTVSKEELGLDGDDDGGGGDGSDDDDALKKRLQGLGYVS